ncbi:MAG: DMT family transporter [Pseudomonadota bacterium]
MSSTTAPSPAATTRHPLDVRAIALMIGICMIWGAQQVVMKSVAGDVAPTMQLAIRFACSTLFFGTLVLRREGLRAFTDSTLPSGLLLGLCFAVEFIFVGEALVHTTAAHTVVFLYSAPIFTALGLQVVPEERLSRGQWLGIALAFIGIAVAFLGYSARPVAELITGDLLALCAGAVWGLSNVVLRRTRVSTASTAKIVLYQVATASLVLFSFSYANGEAAVAPTGRAILALVFQTLVIAIATYQLWFWMLSHYLTSRLMLLSLLTPLFGVAAGVVLLGEPLEARFLVGSLLVLGGILVVNVRQIFNRSN